MNPRPLYCEHGKLYSGPTACEECTDVHHLDSPQPAAVTVVEVAGRIDGLYVFAHRDDADRYAAAVRQHGSEPNVYEEPLIDAATTERLIEAEEVE